MSTSKVLSPEKLHASSTFYVAFGFHHAFAQELAFEQLQEAFAHILPSVPKNVTVLLDEAKHHPSGKHCFGVHSEDGDELIRTIRDSEEGGELAQRDYQVVEHIRHVVVGSNHGTSGKGNAEK